MEVGCEFMSFQTELLGSGPIGKRLSQFLQDEGFTRSIPER